MIDRLYSDSHPSDEKHHSWFSRNVCAVHMALMDGRRGPFESNPVTDREAEAEMKVQSMILLPA